MFKGNFKNNRSRNKIRMYELGNNGTCVFSVKVYKNLKLFTRISFSKITLCGNTKVKPIYVYLVHCSLDV